MDSPAPGDDHLPHEPAPGLPLSLTPLDRRVLREIALESIESGLHNRRPLAVNPEGYSEALQAMGASFVTLKIEGRLRGCVGSLTARRPLVEDVAHNAFAAAFRDTRFPPLGPEEMPTLDLHLSRLTPLVPLAAESRAALLSSLRPGVDGLVVEETPFRATFLPQVWDALPEPEEFVAHLFLKAGLSQDHWSSALRFFRYEVEEF